MIVWLNGVLVDEEDAAISPFNHGLLTGDGVFETLRSYNGAPFAFRRHLARLAHSAAGLALPIPDGAVLREAANAVLHANGLKDGRVRITITGGASPLGSERGTAPTTTIVAAGELGAIGTTIDVVTVPWPRNERGALAGLKTISYGENVRALAYALERGGQEAIFANTLGNLCEGTGTNVFVVRYGEVLTPPPESGCLLGVTRALVLELCAEMGIARREIDVPLRALGEADEAFLTSTTREVQPIASVDAVPSPTAPGPIARQLARAFSDLVARDLDP